jgi:imidazolonepropionase-like amidohydrolase
MLKTLLCAAVFFVFTASPTHAQTTFPVQGIPDARTRWYAFTNAHIHPDTAAVVFGSMIIKDGRIVSVGESLTIPSGAVVVDVQGRHIYPAFVDLYSDYGLQSTHSSSETTPPQRGNRNTEWISDRPGAFGWNAAMRTDYQAFNGFEPDDKSAELYRKAGIGAVLTHNMDGISRGTSALVTTGNEHAQIELIQSKGAHHLSFKKGTSKTAYPGSLMGCIALLRQTYMDGQWYGANKDITDLSLEAWNSVQSLPQIFEVRDWQEVLRAQAIAREFGKTYIYQGVGDAYRATELLKNTGATFIVPLNFPEPFAITGPFDARQISLQDLKHWEWAPANPGAMLRAGIPFVLTANGLNKLDQLFPALRKAIAHGLPENAALHAMTAGPAKLLGFDQELGSLSKGKRANFLIFSGTIFDEESVLYETWVNGKPFVIQPADEPDLDGKFDLSVGESQWRLEVRGGAKKNEMEIIVHDTVRIAVKSTWDRDRIHLQFKSPNDSAGLYLLSGYSTKGKWSGRGTDPAGNWIDWQAVYRDTVMVKADRDKKNKPFEPASLSSITYPFLPYGNKEKLVAQNWLIRNATLWTNDRIGILQETDMLIRDGFIVQIGKNLAAGNAIIIDAKGKHVTPGIIDEHSHIAISKGVNECTQENTGEVRIGDVVDSEDINIYRQLSGGVTTAQLLHGSCNPIGGQSALIKLRWGSSPEAMKFEGAPGFIKFALGENVKRGNSSSNNRYPNTRMGVEQVYMNAFSRAKEYEIQKKDNTQKTTFRPDLEMETMLEIINKQRFITCHSYVQSEINMLMHVAEHFGFKVNTFTHILEGYKVADKMAKHGAGGSSFSDWWAYKFEVYDAIPYNGALMHQEGIVTAFNSDDPEMARRLNQEAAKAVLYGDVSEEEALKFVTLNPAKLLRIDHRVGSLKPGKDADFVIWSDHPLSIYAVAEATFIDGIKYFDRATDLKMREEIRLERQRLIEKMKANSGGKGRAVSPKVERHYHCDTVEDEIID